MWYWWVIYDLNGKTKEVKGEGFDAEWKAQTNLEARMSEIPPNISMPRGASIASYGIVWEAKR